MMADREKKTGLYIHIPFCVRKCNYCAFLSFPAEDSPRAEYTKALIHELIMRSGAALAETGDRAQKIPVDTVYIGGGTPSVLDVSQMSWIMKTVRKYYDLAPDAEVTLEDNPGTRGRKDAVTRAKLKA